MRDHRPANHLVRWTRQWEDQGMLSNTLAELLKLPASQRVEIAMALWESLTDAEREAELALSPEQEAELDRRLAEHVANPDSAIPWDEVRRKLSASRFSS